MKFFLSIVSVISIEIDTFLFLGACWLMVEKIFIILGKTGVPFEFLTHRFHLREHKVTPTPIPAPVPKLRSMTAPFSPPSSARGKIE